ncbi:hypothetical protein L1987_37794 [Smallanthus sonchifolius]|uniref:Uncharacterized protein n=1 Tax=Smallanthus sonchifolius TaxID=185202 RepID=A0ACB9HIQ1_9ASTR|nr:hypothetical protein L1987_37794 [Smallanthus sonchifolius]
MYFTNLLSQDSQFGPTYDGQRETSLVNLDDSPPLPPNNLANVKKSIRGVNFIHEEDKLLVYAWLNCSLDAVQGTDQKHSQQQYKETTTERTIKKCNFQFEHCWHLLKDQPKWISHTKKDDVKQKKSVNSSPTQKDDVLETGNVTENEVIELGRPMGRKAEKGKQKARGRQTEEIIHLRKMKFTLLEESRAQVKEFYRLKDEKIDYDKDKEQNKICQEDERWRLEAEKLELV